MWNCILIHFVQDVRAYLCHFHYKTRRKNGKIQSKVYMSILPAAALVQLVSLSL